MFRPDSSKAITPPTAVQLEHTVQMLQVCSLDATCVRTTMAQSPAVAGECFACDYCSMLTWGMEQTDIRQCHLLLPSINRGHNNLSESST